MATVEGFNEYYIESNRPAAQIFGKMALLARADATCLKQRTLRDVKQPLWQASAASSTFHNYLLTCFHLSVGFPHWPLAFPDRTTYSSAFEGAEATAI